jgi:hypothetical protein
MLTHDGRNQKGFLEVINAATPLTMVRYAKNTEGAAVGYESSMDNFSMKRMKNRALIKGLQLVGHWGDPGG